MKFTESDVEAAALERLQEVGYTIVLLVNNHARDYKPARRALLSQPDGFSLGLPAEGAKVWN